MLMLGGSVRVAEYATFGTPELAEATLAALEGHTTALMANHGAIAYGADVDAAAELAELLEWACGVYWHASLLGTPRALDDAEREAVVAAAVARGYGGTHRIEAGE
jgi:L-fuculose-phosphate aldolase